MDTKELLTDRDIKRLALLIQIVVLTFLLFFVFQFVGFAYFASELLASFAQ